MRRWAMVSVWSAMALAACGTNGGSVKTASSTTAVAATVTTSAPVAIGSDSDEPALPARVANANDGAWLGASAESDAFLEGTTETSVGVWVDAPAARPGMKAAVDLALVIDTSGSMGGAKIENARAAAAQLVRGLADGDIVSIDTFSDAAQALVAPTVLTPASRERLLAAIARLRPRGSTNLFEGLSLGEAHAGQAPPSHTVRRVVVVSDGIANVGPSTPEALGALAERGMRFRTQVTSLGVGNDYDEHTLNALAIRSSGRLFHVSDPRELADLLAREVTLLQSTVASDARLEIVPAPGVRVIGADGVRNDWQAPGMLRIPLGALYGGQHREALVKVRIDPAHFERAHDRPLASVRLVFHDPNDGDLEHVQEAVVRVSSTRDAAIVAARENARAKTIIATQEAAHLQIQASQAVDQGRFGEADRDLGAAQQRIITQAAETKDEAQKKRLQTAAESIAARRRAAGAAAAAPKAVQRDEALKMNHQGMSDLGY